MDPIEKENNSAASVTPGNAPAPIDFSFYNKVLKVVAFPIAAVSGWWTTLNSARGDAYRMGTEDGSIKDIVDAYHENKKPYIKARIEGKLPLEEFLKIEDKLRAQYRLDTDARMAHMGHGTLTGQMKYLRRSLRQKAALEGMTAAGVTLGVLLTVAESKVLATLFGSEAKKDDDAKER